MVHHTVPEKKTHWTLTFVSQNYVLRHKMYICVCEYWRERELTLGTTWHIGLLCVYLQASCYLTFIVVFLRFILRGFYCEHLIQFTTDFCDCDYTVMATPQLYIYIYIYIYVV